MSVVTAQTLPRRDSLHCLRELAARYGVAEQRQGQNFVLAIRLREEEIRARYDPTHPQLGIQLSIPMGPMPDADVTQQKIIERALEINHAYGRRFGCGLAISPDDGAANSTNSDSTNSTSTPSTPSTSGYQRSALTLQSAIGPEPVDEESLLQRLHLLALAARHARDLIARVLSPPTLSP